MSTFAPTFASMNLAYVALLIGAFSKSLSRVRILLVMAAAFFVTFGVLQGIRSMIVWNLIIGGLNLQRLLVAFWRKNRVVLTGEEETLRRRFFLAVTPGDFRALWHLGEEVSCTDRVLIESGTVPDRLYMIVRGTVNVERDGEVLQVLGDGAVLGRLDYSPIATPSSNWRASGAVLLRSWRILDLQESGSYAATLDQAATNRAIPERTAAR